MKTKMNWITWAGAATLLTLGGVGCNHDPAPKEHSRNVLQEAKDMDKFPAEDDSRPYRRFMIAQAAAGARHDGMLYENHFDGDVLNSLGESKLSLMLKDNDHAFPVVVYMNVPDDAHLKARENAVATWLIDSGLQDHQVKFEMGPNPNARSSAAQNLARFNKTESESGVASNPTSPSAPGYGTGGGNAGGDGGSSAGK
jgi:hypothetical protein